MSIVVLIGRILFVWLFANSALGHLSKTKMLAGYAASKGVPAAWLSTFVSGILLALGSISVLLGIWADLGSLFLVAFLVPTAVLMHGFWKESDAGARQQEMVQFNKDLSLAGAALALFAFFAYAGDHLGLTITGPLFHLS